MFRVLPLPDAVNSLGAMSGTQGTYGTGPKPAGEQTPNDATQMNTIFASLDGDKNTLINQSEAQTDIDASSKSFFLGSGQQIIDKVADFASDKLGTNNASTYVQNLYAQFTSGFNVQSSKIELSENENRETAQSQLDKTTQEAIQQELTNINKSVQQAYESALAELCAEIQKQEAESSQTEVTQQQPEYNLSFDGIHTQPVNHDGTRIKGAGLEHTSGDNKIGVKIHSTDSATFYGQKSNVSGYIEIDMTPGYTTTAEGGKYANSNVKVGISYALNDGSNKNTSHKTNSSNFYGVGGTNDQINEMRRQINEQNRTS